MIIITCLYTHLSASQHSLHAPCSPRQGFLFVCEPANYGPDKTTACSINTHHPIKNTLANITSPEDGEGAGDFLEAFAPPPWSFLMENNDACFY